MHKGEAGYHDGEKTGSTIREGGDIMQEIRDYGSFKKIEPVNKGLSNDKKYYIEAIDGRRLISSNTLSSIYWAITFGEKEITTMKNQARDVLSWFKI